MVLYFKILIDLACSALFWWGGFNWHNARRFIMPIVMALSLLWLTHSVWAVASLSSIGILVLGYGVKSPLRHCFGDGWGRGVWGVLSALCLSLGLFLSGHLVWYFFVPYLAVNFTLENALKRLPQWLGDPIIGIGFGCLVFLVH